MNLKEAINIRKSRRKYMEREITPELIQELENLVDKYNKESGLNIQLILNNGEAFNSFKKTYGIFKSVKNYFAIIGKKSDKDRMEKEGYFGEKLVLDSVCLGLSTCWLGGFYDKNSCICKIEDDEVLDGLITLGYAEKKHSTGERIMESLVHFKNKKIEKIMECNSKDIPDWFISGIDAVYKAPSAANLRPFLFKYENEILSAYSIQKHKKVLIDLGIAKLHFEIGSGGGSWEWGDGGKFIR